jgi:hypothetical protein
VRDKKVFETGRKFPKDCRTSWLCRPERTKKCITLCIKYQKWARFNCLKNKRFMVFSFVLLPSTISCFLLIRTVFSMNETIAQPAHLRSFYCVYRNRTLHSMHQTQTQTHRHWVTSHATLAYLHTYVRLTVCTLIHVLDPPSSHSFTRIHALIPASLGCTPLAICSASSTSAWTGSPPCSRTSTQARMLSIVAEMNTLETTSRKATCAGAGM